MPLRKAHFVAAAAKARQARRAILSAMIRQKREGLRAAAHGRWGSHELTRWLHDTTTQYRACSRSPSRQMMISMPASCCNSQPGQFPHHTPRLADDAAIRRYT